MSRNMIQLNQTWPVFPKPVAIWPLSHFEKTQRNTETKVENKKQQGEYSLEFILFCNLVGDQISNSLPESL